MSDLSDKRSDTTRDQILRAAAHQFAQRPYYAVGLDDILAQAQLTKGAMYFHFRSKHALALAIVDVQTETYGEAVQNLLARKLSGLETLIDFCYLIAVADITQDVTRASFNLLESLGRTEKLQERLLGGWIQLLGEITERGIVEGDIIEQGDPEDVGRLLVSIYVGCGRPAIWTSRCGCWVTSGRHCRRFCAASCNRTGATTSPNSSSDVQLSRSRPSPHRKARNPAASVRQATTARSNPGMSRAQCRHRNVSAPTCSSVLAHLSRPGGPTRRPCSPMPGRPRRAIRCWARGGRSHRTSATRLPREPGRPSLKKPYLRTARCRPGRSRARGPGSAPAQPPRATA